MSREDIKKLAQTADVDVRTVTSLLAGAEVRPASRRRIEKAAQKLKLKLP